jgi:hypothetical protein
MTWLLFIATLPGQNSGLRVRFWRQMKALGAAILRDGVYLLPQRDELRQSLEEVRGELSAAGASAYVLQLPKQDAELEDEWLGLFDRAEAYRECRAELDALLKRLREWSEAEARRQFRLWHKGLEAAIAIDYFPGEGRERLLRAAADAEARLTRHYSPDEPLTAHQAIPRLARRDYQGRRWATRRRPWVDRIACAWLIRRFIDKDASFVWLNDIRRVPKDALSFDFDGATFTHVDDKVTFEVLLHAFSLEKDAALVRLGEMVHGLDVGGVQTGEATGFEAMLSGARARIDDDDQLLAEMAGALDSFYVHFQSGKTSK